MRSLQVAETMKKEMGDNLNITSEKSLFPRLTGFDLSAKWKEPQ
jgi:hypothetical protein